MINEMLPPMLFGEELKRKLTVLPEYDNSVRQEDAGTRLLKLADMYEIFVPTAMTIEIYHKLYMMTATSLSKKDTLDSIRQLNANHQGTLGVITGMTSSTIISPSGTGKSSSIQKAISLFDGLIEISSPYQKICPVVCVTCPFDANYKGLLLQILTELDKYLNTNFYEKSQKSTMNAQQLLAMICQICTLHVGLLVIDEIQFLAEQKNAGPQLLRMILQLVNSSGINVVMVGTNECIPFFQKVPQIARRTVGLQYGMTEYGDDFVGLCRTLFQHQYVKQYTELTDATIEWLYEHSGGVLASLVSLIHDAQEIAILNGTEALNMRTLDEAYNKRLQMLHTYISPAIIKTTQIYRKKEHVVLAPNTTEVNIDKSINEIVEEAKNQGKDIVAELKLQIVVLEVEV